MMLTVHKYDLPYAGLAAFDLPVGARALSVAFQGKNLVLWALVNTDAPAELAKFAVLMTGTGSTGLDCYTLEFVGTATEPNGLGPGSPYVVHVFRELSK